MSPSPYTGAPGTPKDALDTPALCLDLDAFDRNVARMAGTFKKTGVGWRPHTKGIKVPAIAHRLIAAGAFGVTCAKVSEAEVMAQAGIRDILVANEVIGEIKTRRLAYLCRQADVVVGVDSPVGIAQLDKAAGEVGTRPRVLVEVNTGMNRCGVQPGDPAAALARRVADSPNLRFAGVMGWEGHATTVADPDEKRAAVKQAVGQLTASADACRAAGLDVQIVSCSGTGTYAYAAELPGVTEVQAGGGVLGDVHYRDDYHVDHETALTVLTTIISRPTDRTIITDGGFKTLGTLYGAHEPIGVAKDSIETLRYSAEHGIVRLKEPANTPKVGDRLEYIVGYSDSTVFLHDTLHGIRHGKVEAAWDIAGRGKLQ
ncbi:MAG TPA: DSD1 family PLP-dependent enzyme [Chloroflexota bacterium]|nr:DSD1 family PLP-dependent enzyme [Chloroflexota bacterium]